MEVSKYKSTIYLPKYADKYKFGCEFRPGMYSVKINPECFNHKDYPTCDCGIKFIPNVGCPECDLGRRITHTWQMKT